MTKVVAAGHGRCRRPSWPTRSTSRWPGLQPARWYWYQFSAAGRSQPGRPSRDCAAGRRTSPSGCGSPSPRASITSKGFFTAYEHMAQEDLDLIVHLGDYIYEYAGKEKLVRKHVGRECRLAGRLPQPPRAIQDATSICKRPMPRCPWLVTWDDHEFDNNYADAISEKNRTSTRPGFSSAARGPIRPITSTCRCGAPQFPKGPDMRLYRRVGFGRLAEFAVLDTRQYRTDQPCGDGNKPPCDEVLRSASHAAGRRARAMAVRRPDARRSRAGTCWRSR